MSARKQRPGATPRPHTNPAAGSVTAPGQGPASQVGGRREDPASTLPSWLAVSTCAGSAPGAHARRGAERYHVFAQAGRNRRPATPGGPAHSCTSFEPTLALAHLIEHAVINFECAIL